MSNKKNKIIIQLTITIILTLGLSISLQSILAAWTTPTTSPPNKNVDEPINQGLFLQNKSGPLELTINTTQDTMYLTDTPTLTLENTSATHNTFRVNDEVNDTSPFIIDGDGRVGIGTTNPGTLLTVDTSATGEGAILGNIFAGVWNANNDYAVIAHKDFKNVTNNYAFIQNSSGGTWFNAAAGQSLSFTIGAATAKMVINPAGNVGIGTSIPEAKLHVSGISYADYIAEGNDDLGPAAAIGAMQERIALYDTTVQYGTAEANTKIYVNGALVVNAPTPTTGTFSVSQGDKITSNKPSGLIDSSFALPIPPAGAAGTEFVFYIDRYSDHTVYVFAPYSTAKVDYYNNRFQDGFPDSTIEVQAGQIQTFTLGSEDVPHRFYATAPVIMLDLGSGGDRIFVPPASREVVHTMSENRYTTRDGTISCSANTVYCYSDALMSSTQIADGTGGDADMGLPYKMLGDTYIITHAISDFAIASIEPNTIRVYSYSSGWNLYNEYDHTAASRSNPIKTEVGDQNGSGADFITDTPVLFVGTAPFYLRLNGNSNREYPAIGYRQSLRNLVANDSGDLSSGGYWTLSGNNLHLEENSYNVGIGIADPGTNKLRVEGVTMVNGDFYLGTAADDDNQDLYIANLIRDWDDPTNYYINVDGTSRFKDLVVTNQVGIGTDSPGGKLDIYQAGAGTTLRITTADESHATDEVLGSLEFYHPSADGDSGFGSNIPTQLGYIRSVFTRGGCTTCSYEDAGLTFGTLNYDNSTPQERMRITSNGNVGIGTTGPNHKLHVDAQADGVVSSFYGGNSDGIRATIYVDDSNDYSALYSFDENDGGATSYKKLYLGHYNDATKSLIVDGATGNVGIGTTDPGEKLDVNGNVKITDGNSLVVNNSSGDSLLFLGNYTDGGFSYSGRRANLTIEGYINANQLCLRDDCKTNWSEIVTAGGLWQINGSDIYYNDGEVGIGTDSPGAKLDVFGGSYASTNEHLRTSVDYSGTIRHSGIGVSGHGSNWGTSLFAQGDEVFTVDTNGGVMIGRTYVDAGTAPSEGLIVEGSVGIGITNPNQGRLQVYRSDTIGGLGGTYTNAALAIANGANDGFYIDENELHQVGDNFNIYADTDGRNINFYVNSGQAMVIEDGGSVGIGTTNPGAKLSVNGGVHVGGISDPGDNNLIADGKMAVGGGYAIDPTYNITTPGIYANTGEFTNLCIGGGTGSNCKASWDDIVLAGGMWGGDKAGDIYNVNSGNVGIGTPNPSAELEVAGWYGRTAHNNGGLVGSYNNVGENSSRSNPIYVIGSNYKPNEIDLNNMYGIGYTHTNASFITDPGPNSWGMYVAADGDARIFLAASASGDSYFNAGNVGIGTTNPGAKLDVNGQAMFGSASEVVEGTENLIYGNIDNTSTGNFILLQNENVDVFAVNNNGYLYINQIYDLDNFGYFIILDGSSVFHDIKIDNNLIVQGNLYDDTGDLSINDWVDVRYGIHNDSTSGIIDVYFNDNVHINGGLCVDNDGDCTADAPGSGNAYIEGDLTVNGDLIIPAGDVAEGFDVNTEVEPGDVLIINLDKSEQLKKSDQPYDKLVAGVVSTEPAIKLGDKEKTQVALAGTVLVKVVNEAGEIRPGDMLTTSSVPGHAMKCAEIKKCFGATIGKALESLTQEQGRIKMIVGLQ